MLLTAFAVGGVQAQTAVQTVTIPNAGQKTIVGSNAVKQVTDAKSTTDLQIIWQTNEAYATLGGMQHADLSAKNFINWNLNDQRAALYGGENNVAEWEVAGTSQWPIIASNEAGTAYLYADGTTLKVLDPATGSTINTVNFTGAIARIAVKEDGTGYFVSYADGDNYKLSAFSISDSAPKWTKDGLSDAVVGFAVPDDDSKLIVAFPQGIRKIWVLDPESGTVIQDDIPYYDNSPTQSPALSDGGEYLAYTDFNGSGYLYHWEDGQYVKVWSASIAGTGASSTWGCGNAISPDGSIVAFGSLDFVSSGYDGKLWVFHNYSDQPAWVSASMGDEVSFLSISDDANLIAVASYGPLNHSTSDFFLFRSQCSEPIAELNTTGSIEYVDLSSDGNTCILGGKAVHCREMGYGSRAFFVNCVPQNSGNLVGSVDLLGTDDDSGAIVTIAGIDDYFATTAEDGSFNLRFVPAGTYSVTVTKPGYYPVTQNDVAIVSGETTTINVEMESTGLAIADLYASQGAYDYVSLTWTASAGTSGYNIYRKGMVNAPFDAPIATIGAANANYEDHSAIPTKHYYYAVTTINSDGTETPYSNVAMGYVATACITRAIDVYDGTAPTIDGVMSEGEWDDAFTVDVSNYLNETSFGSVILHFKSNGDYLYVCSENHCDSVFDNNDGVAFYIDDNNDKSYPEAGDDSEGNYWMYYGASGNTVRYRPIYNTGGVGTVISLPEQIIGVTMTDNGQVNEFALPIGSDSTWQINPNEQNQSGLYLFVRDAATSTMNGKWPADNTETFIPLYYGVLNFHVTDEVPPAPENLAVDYNVAGEGQYAPVSWDRPDINDFGHFNVYVNSNSVTNVAYGTQIILDVEENTQYDVFVTTVDAAGHESEHSETLSFTTGFVNVDDASASTFRLYPNPVQSTLNVRSAINEGGTVKVMDATGKMLRSFTEDDLSIVSVSVDGLQSGLYFLMIFYSDTIVIRKFIVE